MPFYVDERAIVPRSFAELIADGSIDYWLATGHAPRAGPVHRQRQPGRAGGHGPDVTVTRATCPPTRWRWPASTWSATAWQPRVTADRKRRPGRLPGPYDLIL